MDFSKLRTGEIVASLGGIALFVILFFDWVGAEGSDEGLSGWDYLGGDITGFIVFLAATIWIPLVLGASRDRRDGLFGMPWGGPTTLLGVLAFDILVWRLFTVEGVVGIGGELEFGIFLGLLAAAAIAAGGYLTMAEGGFDPLGLGEGARSTTAASTAPTRPVTATKPAAKPSAARKGAAKKKPAAKRTAARKR